MYSESFKAVSFSLRAGGCSVILPEAPKDTISLMSSYCFELAGSEVEACIRNGPHVVMGARGDR